MMHMTWARFDREISWGLSEFELSMEHVTSRSEDGSEIRKQKLEYVLLYVIGKSVIPTKTPHISKKWSNVEIG